MRCKILWLSGVGVAPIGEGFLHRSGPDTLCHGVSLPHGMVKVEVDKVYDGNNDLALPLPIGDLRVFGDTVGSFLFWPSSFVQIGSQVIIH